MIENIKRAEHYLYRHEFRCTSAMLNISFPRHCKLHSDSANSRINYVRRNICKMADILEQQMQRNDGALLIKTIRYALNTIQELISLQLTPDSLMGVILHMSCMVDRLQKGESLLPHPDKEKRRQDEYWMYMKVKSIAAN